MNWSLRESLDLTLDEAHAAEVRAARIEEANKVDGATVYVPETPAYATTTHFGRKTLARLGVDWRDIANS